MMVIRICIELPLVSTRGEDAECNCSILKGSNKDLSYRCVLEMNNRILNLKRFHMNCPGFQPGDIILKFKTFQAKKTEPL